MSSRWRRVVACDCRLLWDGLTKKAAATASSDVSSDDSDEDGNDGKMMAAWRLKGVLVSVSMCQVQTVLIGISRDQS